MNGPSSGTQFNIWELVPETDGRHRRPLRQTNPDQRFLFQESVPVISDWPHDGGLDGPNSRRFPAPSQWNRVLIRRATRLSSWSKAGSQSFISSAVIPAARRCARRSSSMVEMTRDSARAAEPLATPKNGLAFNAASMEAPLPLRSLMPVSGCRRRKGCGLISKAGESTQRPQRHAECRGSSGGRRCSRPAL